jgi:predicted acetyltransferase
VELEVMLDVQDAFLDRGGRFRLRGGPDGASCELVSSGGSDLVMDIATLGALLFGGARAEALARAGRLLTDDEAVLRRVDAAFLAERVPQHGTEF